MQIPCTAMALNPNGIEDTSDSDRHDNYHEQFISETCTLAG